MSLPPGAESAENPESPTSPAPVPPQRSRSSRLFAPTPSSTLGDLPDSPPSLSPLEAAETSSTSGQASPLSSEDDGPSAIRSTGKELKLSKAGLKTGVGAIFANACRILGAILGDQEDRAVGVWAPDAEDVDDVARPAANLIYRRLPDDAKGGDLIDLAALGLALVGYVGKSLQLRAEVRSMRQLQEAQGVVTEPGQA